MVIKWGDPENKVNITEVRINLSLSEKMFLFFNFNQVFAEETAEYSAANVEFLS
jgi:hypothetical protein